MEATHLPPFRPTLARAPHSSPPITHSLSKRMTATMHQRAALKLAAVLAVAPAGLLADAFLLPPSAPLAAPSSSATTSTALDMNKKAKRGGGGSGGGFGKKVTTNNIRTKKKPSNPNFVYAGSLRPHEQSPTRLVDPAAVLAIPDYAIDGVPKKKGSSYDIEVKTPEDIEKMRAAGRAAREVLDIAGELISAAHSFVVVCPHS